MTSERRQKANRRNARKSTGPKTAEGKARSRQNAMKHGLTGQGTVLPPEDLELFEERLEDWMEDADPDDPMETYLVRMAVLSTVRIDRCARQEFAVIARKRRDSIEGWQGRQIKGIGKLLAHFEEAPGAVVEALHESAGGCEWLVGQWEELLQEIERQEAWTACHATRALRLLGFDPAGQTDDPRAQAVRQELAAGGPGPIEPGSERDRLRATIREQVARLQALAESLWSEEDGPSLAEAINLGGLDASPEGALRHRYETASMRLLHRAVDQILRIRKGRVAEEDQPSEAAVVPNEANAPVEDVRPELDESCTDPDRAVSGPQIEPPAAEPAPPVQESTPQAVETPGTEPPPPNRHTPVTQMPGVIELDANPQPSNGLPTPAMPVTDWGLCEVPRELGGCT